MTEREAERLGLTPRKLRKYRNVPTVVDGIRFDSKREAARWSELKLLEKAGKIEDLQRQARYELRVNGALICHYNADFIYIENGQRIVEDAKGVRTREYKLKKKLMKAVHGIDIVEV